MLPVVIMTMCFYQGMSSQACQTPALAYFSEIHGEKYVDNFVREYSQDIPTDAEAAGFLANSAIHRRLSVSLSKDWKINFASDKDIISYGFQF